MAEKKKYDSDIVGWMTRNGKRVPIRKKEGTQEYSNKEWDALPNRTRQSLVNEESKRNKKKTIRDLENQEGKDDAPERDGYGAKKKKRQQGHKPKKSYADESHDIYMKERAEKTGGRKTDYDKALEESYRIFKKQQAEKRYGR